MIFLILMVSSFQTVIAGSAGKCRSECVERNQGFIVRAHLKDNLAMVGVCKNSTLPSSKSIVTPFICDRDIGVWTFDLADEEGIVKFGTVCPTAKQYTVEQLADCPSNPIIMANSDGDAESFVDNSSGDKPIE